MKKKLLILFCFALYISVDAQVTQINNNNSLHSIGPLTNGKTVFYSDIDSSIWSTDGTPGNTIQISTVKYDNISMYLNGKIYFSGFTSATGAELYVTDGTSGGTSLVKDINAGAAGSDPGDMIVFNGNLYFSAITVAEGREIWKSDGTSGGTSLLKDIVAGAGSSNGSEDSFHLFTNGSFLLFAAQSSGAGVELWKSDGTTGGTNLLKDINSGTDSSNPREFALLNSSILFLATDATHGEELWKTDGTSGGTVLVKDINPGTGSSTEVEIFPGLTAPVFLGFHLFNNHAYFNAYDGTSSNEVWSTDGTAANTILIKDFGGATFTAFALVSDAVNYSSKFIFPFTDGASRSELWQTDGTPAGTVLFKSFVAVSSGDIPEIYIPFSVNFTTGSFNETLFEGNKFFFVAGSSANGNELWISDGTVGGTNMVKDINPGTNDGIQNNETYLYTTTSLYFAADDGTNGNELWVSDGTSGGTTIVKDINPNAGDANPDMDPSIVSNGKIFFSATDGDDANHTDLFVVDGSFQALPVKLTTFIVTKNNNDALLQWNTQQEINTESFVVQRSDDAQHFEDIGNVKANGTTDLRSEYSFTDANIISSGRSIVYYRLRILDKDGKSAFSNVITLKIKDNQEWSVHLLSNPVQANIPLMITGVTGKLKLMIKDVSGKILYARTLDNVNGQIALPISLPKGMYLLESQSNDQRRVVKFIK